MNKYWHADNDANAEIHVKNMLNRFTNNAKTIKTMTVKVMSMISKDELMEMGRAPPTCFECSFHKVAVCKKFNCWSRHLAEVTRDAEASFAI